MFWGMVGWWVGVVCSGLGLFVYQEAGRVGFGRAVDESRRFLGSF